MGSGIYKYNNITNCLFRNNTSARAGGAIYLISPGDLLIENCTFYGNNALDGSSIYYEETYHHTLILNNNSFYQNLAGENGAALYISFSMAIFLTNCTFFNNTVQENQKNLGSVLFLNNPGNSSIILNNFEKNKGVLGTCIYYSETSKIIIFSLKFEIWNFRR